MINIYKNLKSPKVLGEIDVYDFLDRISNPTEKNKSLINSARAYYKLGLTEEYDNIKTILLPCFTLNFSFNGSKRNQNIKNPSGFIYLDVDDCLTIDLNNPLIYACWKSLSGTGLGILVKVDGLTLDNFKDTYNDISNKLNLKTDARARSATQSNVQSYDENIYTNEDSLTWTAKGNSKKRPNSITYTKRGKKDAIELETFCDVRYNNLDMIDFDGEDYIFFPDEKEMIAKLWIPKVIKEGSRNEVISSIAYQYRALNPTISDKAFERFVINVNSSRCNPPLDEGEVLSIAKRVNKMDILNPFLNSPRRIIFNPESTLSRKEKLIISCKLNGKRKRKLTLSKIKNAINNWDCSIQGKMTQKKLSEFCGVSKGTISRYKAMGLL